MAKKKVSGRSTLMTKVKVSRKKATGTHKGHVKKATHDCK